MCHQIEPGRYSLAQGAQDTEERTHIRLYDEYEVVYPVKVKLAAPFRALGKGLMKFAENFNLDPYTQEKFSDWLDPNDYPETLGGSYPDSVKAFYPSNFERSGTNYLGSNVIQVISSQEIMSNPGFVDVLDFKYNVDAGSIWRINVRGHYTEILYSPPVKGK